MTSRRGPQQYFCANFQERLAQIYYSEGEARTVIEKVGRPTQKKKRRGRPARRRNGGGGPPEVESVDPPPAATDAASKVDLSANGDPYTGARGRRRTALGAIGDYLL